MRPPRTRRVGARRPASVCSADRLLTYVDADDVAATVEALTAANEEPDPQIATTRTTALATSLPASNIAPDFTRLGSRGVGRRGSAEAVVVLGVETCSHIEFVDHVVPPSVPSVLVIRVDPNLVSTREQRLRARRTGGTEHVAPDVLDTTTTRSGKGSCRRDRRSSLTTSPRAGRRSTTSQLRRATAAGASRGPTRRGAVAPVRARRDRRSW